MSASGALAFDRGEEACLYTVLTSAPENHDRILRETIAPIVREIEPHPYLHSCFSVRFNEPTWQLRFRILGRPEWIEGPVRPLVRRGAESAVAAGLAEKIEYGEYQREWERYGGPEGMRLS